MKTDLLIDTYGTRIGSSGERIVLSFPKIQENLHRHVAQRTLCNRQGGCKATIVLSAKS